MDFWYSRRSHQELSPGWNHPWPKGLKSLRLLDHCRLKSIASHNGWSKDSLTKIYLVLTFFAVIITWMATEFKSFQKKLVSSTLCLIKAQNQLSGKRSIIFRNSIICHNEGHLLKKMTTKNFSYFTNYGRKISHRNSFIIIHTLYLSIGVWLGASRLAFCSLMSKLIRSI